MHVAHWQPTPCSPPRSRRELSVASESLAGCVNDCCFRQADTLSAGMLANLRARIPPVCQRTLREQVIEYVRYTKRIPITPTRYKTLAESIRENAKGEALIRALRLGFSARAERAHATS